MIPLYLVSLPRCGTNLLAATLHAHPAIWSLAHAATRIQEMQQWRGLDAILARPALLPAQPCIYPRARPAKDVAAVRYVLFDKVTPGKKRPPGKTLVLLREPEGIIASMDRFAQKYHRPSWYDTPENRARFMRKYEVLKIEAMPPDTHQPDPYNLWLGYYVVEPHDALAGICQWLDIPYSPCEFGGVSACCNAPFDIRDTTAHAGTFWENNDITLPPRPHYHCSACGEPVIGYGGFNPYEKLDVERVMRGTHATG